jgi:hypothetical protein
MTGISEIIAANHISNSDTGLKEPLMKPLILLGVVPWKTFPGNFSDVRIIPSGQEMQIRHPASWMRLYGEAVMRTG